jgi:hypothetical protein
MTNEKSTVPVAVLLLGAALGWPSLGEAASCTISPQNPSISVGGSVSWSASYSGFRRSPRFRWAFAGGQPSSGRSSRPVTVTYPQAGSFTTSLRLGREETSATCTTTVQVGAQQTQGPSTPGGLVASAAGGSQINLTWSASTDPAGVTGYQVFRCQGSSCTPTTQIGTTPSPSYSNSGLATNTTYGYRVRAYDAAGNLSSYSSTARATTAQQQQGCTIAVSPTALAFGNVNVGASGTLATTVSNRGTGNCNVSLRRTGSSAFAINSAGSFNVAPGASGTVSVSYTPTRVGTDTGTVALNSNSSGSPTVNVSLSGSGVQSQAQCNPPASSVSINSTSQLGCPGNPVAEQSQAPNTSYSVLAINDLGMHCGDLDTRILSILPPFNNLHAQVVQKGSSPTLNPTGIAVAYSAASHAAGELGSSDPGDPVLAQGSGAFTGVMGDGRTYKANFWDALDTGAYNPFYPSDLPYIAPDEGLPVPDSALLPALDVAQQSMPGIQMPYLNNDPQAFVRFDSDIQFFSSFAFGYTAAVNWFAAEGLPLSVFDDFGREKAYPLMRVAADQGSTIVATTDTVTPISAEANCQGCHAATQDGGNGTATTDAGIANPAVSLDDPQFDIVPSAVSVEWASDRNILKLHDRKNGTHLITGTTEDFPTAGTTSFEPMVCQTCHYTPALDLAQVGPNDVNGRQQSNNQSMSRVMHNFHGALKDSSGNPLFPPIPAPVQDATTGAITNQSERVAALEGSCYQCHPGKRTQCLRGAMFNADMLCADCHGNMPQVGNDFSKCMVPGTAGCPTTGPILAGDFYTNPDTPRVPWANEPSCGSCHTGDASSNLADLANTVVNAVDTGGNTDGIRLRRAYLTGDTKATPIVPSNKRFAEVVVDPSATGAPGTNPKLYRVSNGHGGVMCEGCHGSTHAIWPNANPNANDNLTASQLQGHTGPIVECSTCHGTTDLGSTLDGPHGMHPVGNTRFARGGHENLAQSGACVACHGATATSSGRSQNVGTVLSRAAATRTISTELGTVTIQQGQVVGCSTCHSGSGSGGD